MFSGPSLPYKLYNSAMVTSPDDGGVILFGGYNYDKNAYEDTLLELRYYKKSTDEFWLNFLLSALDWALTTFFCLFAAYYRH